MNFTNVNKFDVRSMKIFFQKKNLPCIDLFHSFVCHVIIEGQISLWPLIGGRGQVIEDEGSKVNAFCSASCTNCSRPQWFDPNGIEIAAEGRLHYVWIST